MSIILESFDDWLKDDGPAALVLREHLAPVEGPDGVLFPATFAAGDGFPGGYNIDQYPDGRNVCLIDSIGSQANRIEPLFTRDGYAGLVPQIVIKAGERRVNLLDAGHRAGDAIVRCTVLQEELRNAFKAAQKGEVQHLAKLAPTSIVFGVWDSRETQAKLPRLIVSTIRAFNVRRLTRSAQYVPAVEYVNDGLLAEPPDETTKKAYAQRGFIHVPASSSHGGVVAEGDIRRDASLHLAGLRLITAGDAQTDTLALRRYILGLALTAFTYPAAGYLRQGCHLVSDSKKSREFKSVYNDGRREDATLKHSEALIYAKAAAMAFGIDPDRKIKIQAAPDREVDFDRDLAQKDISGDGDKPPKKRGKGKAAIGG